MTTTNYATNPGHLFRDLRSTLHGPDALGTMIVDFALREAAKKNVDPSKSSIDVPLTVKIEQADAALSARGCVWICAYGPGGVEIGCVQICVHLQ